MVEGHTSEFPNKDNRVDITHYFAKGSSQDGFKPDTDTNLTHIQKSLPSSFCEFKIFFEKDAFLMP